MTGKIIAFIIYIIISIFSYANEDIAPLLDNYTINYEEYEQIDVEMFIEEKNEEKEEYYKTFLDKFDTIEIDGNSIMLKAEEVYEMNNVEVILTYEEDYAAIYMDMGYGFDAIVSYNNDGTSSMMVQKRIDSKVKSVTGTGDAVTQSITKDIVKSAYDGYKVEFADTLTKELADEENEDIYLKYIASHNGIDKVEVGKSENNKLPIYIKSGTNKIVGIDTVGLLVEFVQVDYRIPRIENQYIENVFVYSLMMSYCMAGF